MFGQIKKILGIEGVKIDVEVIQPVIKNKKLLNGTIKLSTMTEAEVVSIGIKLIEKYTRGRGDSKLINDYVIGFIELDEKIYLKKNDMADIPFELPFILTESEMDKIENSNFITSGIVKLAKKVKGVKSEFRIEAEAIVAGTKLNPIITKEIIMN
jgi:hypothetical protein